MEGLLLYRKGAVSTQKVVNQHEGEEKYCILNPTEDCLIYLLSTISCRDTSDI
jgi:hypothetical protein